MNKSIKLTLDHHLTWWGWFPVSLPCRPFLGWYISSLLYISLAPCEADAYLIPSAHSLLLRKYIAHPALHELPWIILSFYHLLEKLHLSSAPAPLGKTSINTDLFFPLGACPFWCLLLSLIGSYSSKLCQGSLEFFLRCIFSRMPRKRRDSWGEHWKNVQIRLPIFIPETPKMQRHDWSFK